jgi:hypothetical protein
MESSPRRLLGAVSLPCSARERRNARTMSAQAISSIVREGQTRRRRRIRRMVITQESNAGFDCVPGDEGAAPGVKATETFGRESRFDDLDWTWRLNTYVSGRFGELDGRDSIRERNESRRRGKRATFSPLTSDANWDWVLTNSVG